VEINWLNPHDTLKMNPRIENNQNHKKLSQALHEEGKKNKKKWRSLVKPMRGIKKQKLDLVVFSIFFKQKGFDNSKIFMIKDNLENIYLNILFNIFNWLSYLIIS